MCKGQMWRPAELGNGWGRGTKVGQKFYYGGSREKKPKKTLKPKKIGKNLVLFVLFD